MPSSDPARLVEVGKRLFFTADDGVHGRELWKSDGTKAGTALVKDIRPGTYSYSDPRDLTAVGGTLFFTADDGVHGRELWKSDGTRAGTVLVKNIRTDGTYGYDSYPSYLTAVGGTLFFSADDGVHGRELWKSDGTSAGTVLVKNIRTDTGYYSSSGPYSLTAVGGTLFFSADDGVHGRELWKSDGTRAGTVLVKNIRPGDYSSGPTYLTGVGRTLFFTAADGSHGRELWKSDGTSAGTVLVKNITPVGSSDPSSLIGAGGRLFFSADDGTHGGELWKSDGSAVGTVLVKDISPGSDSSGYYGPIGLTAVGGRVFFAADDGTHGEELWRSDGTASGTVLVKNIRPVEYGSDPYSLTDVGGTLFFTAADGSHGRELWKSDGSAAGTVLVKDIHPCANGYAPRFLTGVAGRLFFAADDGTHGRELWKSDGSAGGTVMVEDINTGGSPKAALHGTAPRSDGPARRD